LNRRFTLLVSAVCVTVLLIALACLAGNLLSSLPLFAERWASQPDWSSDSEKIVFTCHYPSLPQVWEDRGKELFQWGYIPDATEICVMDMDSGGLVRLTDNSVSDTSPAWSPSGQLIAYETEAGEGNTIAIVERDGTLVETFTTNLDILSTQDLVWSPDGKRICFAARDSLQHDQGINLYLADLEREVVDPLTTLPGDELECQWSPDETQVAFVSYPTGFKWLLSEEAIVQTIDEEKLNTVVEGFAGIGDLSWSPDGTQMAFWAYPSPDCAYDCAGIYVVNLGDGLTECLAVQHKVSVLFEVAWSPDGKQIAFTGQSSAGPGIYTVTPDGKDLLRVAPLFATSDHSLAWSPDQESVVFVHGAEGDTHEIWLVHTETGALKKLDIP
jgi:Tol biopolymer transport system component